MTRIAVVSSDGVHVDGHFGKADRFFIYDLEDAGPKLVQTRPSTPLSVNDPNHSFDADRFEAVYRVLQDCQKVYVIQIGDIPGAKLREKGIEPVVFSGPIATIEG